MDLTAAPAEPRTPARIQAAIPPASVPPASVPPVSIPDHVLRHIAHAAEPDRTGGHLSRTAEALPRRITPGPHLDPLHALVATRLTPARTAPARTAPARMVPA